MYGPYIYSILNTQVFLYWLNHLNLSNSKFEIAIQYYKEKVSILLEASIRLFGKAN
jgi:hypothetical protein